MNEFRDVWTPNRTIKNQTRYFPVVNVFFNFSLIACGFESSCADSFKNSASGQIKWTKKNHDGNLPDRKHPRGVAMLAQITQVNWCCWSWKVFVKNLRKIVKKETVWLSPVIKFPEISSPLKNYTELSSPVGKALKFWESPLGFWAVNNRIQSSHPLKARDFPSLLAFGYPSLYPHWLKSFHRFTEIGV